MVSPGPLSKNSGPPSGEAKARKRRVGHGRSKAASEPLISTACRPPPKVSAMTRSKEPSMPKRRAR